MQVENHLFLLLPPFFCLTAPQAFLHPDRGCPRPTRAEAVQIGRRSEHATFINVSRPRLDRLKRGGTLVIAGPEGILFGSFSNRSPLLCGHLRTTIGSVGGIVLFAVDLFRRSMVFRDIGAGMFDT